MGCPKSYTPPKGKAKADPAGGPVGEKGDGVKADEEADDDTYRG